MGTAIVITSGKGGTGKTSMTGGVGSCLAAMGRRVLCVDTDIGLRNLDLTLGMSDQVLMDFTDVIEGRCALRDAAVSHQKIKNLFLLTAPILTSPESIPVSGMQALIRQAKEEFDYVLLDAPAGLGAGFTLASCAADRGIVVSTTDSSSLRDAQRTASVLLGQVPTAHLVINRVRPKILRRLNTTIDDAMDFTGLPLLGLVPEDERVSISANRGIPVITVANSGAPTAYHRIARRLEGESVPLKHLR
jgi:septum site-determining protein MinD